MPDLIAQGAGDGYRWRKGLPELVAGVEILMGRQPSGDAKPVTVVSANQPTGETDTDDSNATEPEPYPARDRRRTRTVHWQVPWDHSISRSHAILTALSNDRLQVLRDERARNPIFFRGRPRDRFVLVPGEHFVIGETTFTLARRPGFTDQVGGVGHQSSGSRHQSIAERAADASTPRPGPIPAELRSDIVSDRDGVTEMAFEASALRDRDFRDTRRRIQLLARLPDIVAGSVDDEELLVRVSDTLLRATPSASTVAIVQSDPVEKQAFGGIDHASDESGDMKVLHYDCRENLTQQHAVSSRLVKTALKRRESVLHLWDSQGNRGVEYTAAENVDWAFCVPLRSDACAGWAIYVAGSRALGANWKELSEDSGTLADRLGDDVKFAEVVGSLISGIRQTSHFQQRHLAMRRFFAPVVLDALSGQDPQSWLQPRQCDLSVMFCDLRGFSRTSEMQSDQLLLLLEQVSAALGVMTRHILDTGGVIGDFHGDAAMGFWGWPIELQLEHPEADLSSSAHIVASVLAAAKAAAGIRLDYASGNTEFRCGIGIASGPAVAGRIGTVDQVKVTAFGPVVNLASRLEGLTKHFGVEILLDHASADALRSWSEHLQSTTQEPFFRLRKLGRVRAAGLKIPVDVYQLVVPVEGQSNLSDAQIEAYHQGWEEFARGEWDSAYERLLELPAWDRPKDVLLRIILQHHRTAPAGWDGVLDFPK
ncbi:adenylate/guanylate cyclase domain-containing protein [Rhodopirellula sp. JC740]|uniref:Adenylate/guanylate cyclase domain-containing protein n=1 Tax=Rhodopirellula halodulae TaxID=2894198 RepID=A0ABS8NIU7_9BACT|nr:adenylate/guanylate cyclase domain-containing protein [Rhodopirellula sp. JC740]MCC9643480.1 adenylate/guanylate cyclase domain-containing protein [Rhodopirellula sp. JC740]